MANEELLTEIKDSCKEMGLPEPEFQEIGDTFRVNIYRAPAMKVADKVAELVAPTDVDKPTAGEIGFLEAIKALLATGDWFTNSEVRGLSGLAEGSVKRYLRNLTAKKILIAEGERKSRHYRMNR
jgi:predicted HTH transcriptional regulator